MAGAGKKDAGEGAYSGLKTEDISALLTDGRRDGEQKFVKEADGVFVYVWNMATYDSGPDLLGSSPFCCPPLLGTDMR